METLKFKTNIKCAGCIATVTPALNSTVGENKWNVDLQSPEKTLTVSKDEVNESEILSALQKVGYQAEKLN